MALNLASLLPLLGQRSVAGLPVGGVPTTPGIVPNADELEAARYANGIDVSGQRPELLPPQVPVEAAPQAPIPVEARIPLEGLVGKQVSKEDYQRSLPASNLPERKGMFGMKGTLRDIIGMLGDAFLIQSGNNPIYTPARQKEKMADALIGMSPGKERDAIARAMSVDPSVGMPLYKDWQDRLGDESQRDILRSKAQTDATDKRNELLLKARDRAARLIAASQGDPAKMQEAMTQIEDLAGILGMSMEDLGLDAGLSPEAAAVYGSGDMTVNQQQMMDLRRQQYGQRERLETMKEKGRNARDNPPPPVRPQQPTEAAEIARIRGKVNKGQKLDAGDKETWNTYIKGRGRGSRISAPPPPAKGSSASRFRRLD